jgi:diadenosine tetraphosphatase ApaH/serine/threonine PP2A family protein phosphatase
MTTQCDDGRRTMKLALLADIHANVQALQACLLDARSRGATQYAFMGDFVGYGADPCAVLDIVMAYVGYGEWAVRGNHDEAALVPSAPSPQTDYIAAGWTHAQLTPAHRAFIASLPLTVQHGKVLLVHACVRGPQRWTYITQSVDAAAHMGAAHSLGASFVFTGHVHEQRLFYPSAVGKVMAFEPTPGVAVPVRGHREWLATAGSVGQPRDGDPRAMYALYDEPNAQITFLRVPYDHAAAADAIRRAGLPEVNAARLAHGQ